MDIKILLLACIGLYLCIIIAETLIWLIANLLIDDQNGALAFTIVINSLIITGLIIKYIFNIL